MRDFFAAYGIAPSAFDAAFGSPDVERRVRRSDEMIRGYGIKFTPTIVVNGKYRTSLWWTESYETWFEVIDDLVAREHRVRTAPASE